jgi:DNA-binding transcriptional MocR family regulator
VPKASAEADPLKKIDLATALQYGLAQGYPPLLSWVRQFTREHLHPNVPYKGGPDVVLTCGSTDGFSKTLELFVDPWSEDVDDPRDRPGLLCETFVYGNVLSQAMPRGMQVFPIVADDGGMVVDGPGGLEDVLGNWDFSKGKRPSLMYTVTCVHVLLILASVPPVSSSGRLML